MKRRWMNWEELLKAGFTLEWSMRDDDNFTAIKGDMRLKLAVAQVGKDWKDFDYRSFNRLIGIFQCPGWVFVSVPVEEHKGVDSHD